MKNNEEKENRLFLHKTFFEKHYILYVCAEMERKWKEKTEMKVNYLYENFNVYHKIIFDTLLWFRIFILIHSSGCYIDVAASVFIVMIVIITATSKWFYFISSSKEEIIIISSFVSSNFYRLAHFPFFLLLLPFHYCQLTSHSSNFYYLHIWKRSKIGSQNWKHSKSPSV